MRRRTLIQSVTVLPFLAGLKTEASPGPVLVIGAGGAGSRVVAPLAETGSLTVKTFDLVNGSPLARLDRERGFREMTLDDYRAGQDRLDREHDALLEKASGQLLDAILGYDHVVVVAGLGGRSGSRITRFYAEQSSRLPQSFEFALSTPFPFEGEERAETAREVLAVLEASGARRKLVDPGRVPLSRDATLARLMGECDRLLRAHVEGLCR